MKTDRIIMLAIVYAYSLGCGCAAKPTASEAADVLDHAGKLAHCQGVGREAGTYAAYDACVVDGGLRK
jgi:hypothetical protein